MKTIAVTSGKGGVGKTSLSTNLGISLAQRGKRVVLFDADLGLANLDVMLGIKPNYTLEQVLSGQVRLVEALTSGPGGVKFIAGGSGVEALVNLDQRHLHLFLTQLGELEAQTDVLIFDTGAGIDSSVMTFLQAADEVLLVATPDPSSMVDAYATAKVLWTHSPQAKVRVVVNMAADEAEARAVYAKLYSIAKQFLDKAPTPGGFMRMDARAAACVRQRKPFVLENPSGMASRDVQAIAGSLLGLPSAAQPSTLADRFRGLFGMALRKSA